MEAESKWAKACEKRVERENDVGVEVRAEQKANAVKERGRGV